MISHKYIDLFAGCGGLSLGLEKSGFNLELAVEKSDMAAETFYHNFIERIENPEIWEEFSNPKTPLELQVEKGLVVKELASILEAKDVLKDLREKDIDLVAGGPPCQGFSLAGRRNPEDQRNQLPWQFLEFVSAVLPKVVVIENVSGMSQDFRKHGKSSPFNDLRIALTETGLESGYGYKVQPLHLNAMHYGAPQHRPRVMLVGVRNDIASLLDLEVSELTWKSDYDEVTSLNFDERPALAPAATHLGDDILRVRDAISDLNQNGYRRTNAMSEYAEEMRTDTDWMPLAVSTRAKLLKSKPGNHNLRKHAPHIEVRFRLYQYMAKEGIKPNILAIPKDDGFSKENLRKLVRKQLSDPTLPAKSPDGTVIAKDIEELIDLVFELSTKKHSQRPLNWEAPSPTVVSLPDDYVHPSEPRTMTVREMARFQSFPDSFEFRAKETTGSLRRRVEVPQYTQVGNAVPPKLALAIGKLVRDILEASENIANSGDPASKDRKEAS